MVKRETQEMGAALGVFFQQEEADENGSSCNNKRVQKSKLTSLAPLSESQAIEQFPQQSIKDVIKPVEVSLFSTVS